MGPSTCARQLVIVRRKQSLMPSTQGVCMDHQKLFCACGNRFSDQCPAPSNAEYEQVEICAPQVNASAKHNSEQALFRPVIDLALPSRGTP